MSDVRPDSVPAEVPPGPAGPPRREQAEQVLVELLRLMDWPARLELKDQADGGISVALFPQGDYPGLQEGKRSHLMDSLQFLANKMLNKVGVERRWISIGVGQHPEPRGDPARSRAAPAPQATPGPASTAPPRLPEASRPVPVRAPRPSAPPPEEALKDLPVDPRLLELGASLAEKSARLGRYYAVTPMKPEERVALLKGSEGIAGVKVHVEGEGRNRRLVFTPEKPAPMPKRSFLPQDDVEEPED